MHMTLASTKKCRPYILSDNRSFFVREYPQSNLPQRISNSSYQNVLRQLPSLRLVVLGCARNVERDLDKFQSHIEPIIDLFHSSSRILIFESDSKDKTVKKLRQWSRVELYTYSKLIELYPERTDRLAYCRNMLMDKAHLLLPNYIFIVDLDRFSTTVSSFLSNFQYDTNQWSVMTATSHDTYYDIWALRTLSDSVMNYDVWHRVSDLETPLNNYCHASVYDGIVRIHIKRIPIEHGLIEVRSAFNGAGLYKANSTYKCKYDGGGYTCEHVPFHLCIREKNQARIFINPEFQVSSV
ncbi:unnamed protein product [Adineta steineri]|uniref:Uncharacterized protein n=1 Tax=Adineta steineri TaxID=433720 RepID=A0A815LZ98_9BILA|nr:unnamed protein product [Adineta steineri]CAF4007780.1 unnamed protein product [Adineta steineri]